MPAIGAIKVWLEVDGKPLEELKAKLESSGLAVSCYVVSEAGKGFAIKVEDKDCPVVFERETGTEIRPHIDGIRFPARFFRRGKSKTIRNVRVSDTEQRELVFSQLQRTDGDLVEDERPELGTIRVQIRHVMIGPSEFGAAGVAAAPATVIHERTQKAASHCVGLGASTPLRNKPAYHTIQIPRSHEYSFVFRYASLGWLMASNVIPRKPFPLQTVSLPEKDDLKLAFANAVVSSPGNENNRDVSMSGPQLKKRRIEKHRPPALLPPPLTTPVKRGAPPPGRLMLSPYDMRSPRHESGLSVNSSPASSPGVSVISSDDRNLPSTAGLPPLSPLQPRTPGLITARSTEALYAPMPAPVAEPPRGLLPPLGTWAPPELDVMTPQQIAAYRRQQHQQQFIEDQLEVKQLRLFDQFINLGEEH